MVVAAIGRSIGWKWTVMIAVLSVLVGIAVLWVCSMVVDRLKTRHRPRWLASVILPASAVVCVVVVVVIGAGVSRWSEKNTELMLSSFATPNDETSTELFDGRPLEEWLGGSNIENDGRVYNHQILHPDYMTTIMHNMRMVITTRLAGEPVPAASLHNVDLMWDAMTRVRYPAPPYVAPGGTIYDGATEQLYYPDGTDWGTSRRMNFAGFDAFYWAFGPDAARRDEAATWLDIHATQALEMQERFADGRTYGPDDDDTYPGREQWVGLYAAWSYLALQIGQDFETAD